MAAWFSTKISNKIIADSKGIADFYKKRWNTKSNLIEYGAYVKESSNTKVLDNFNLIKQKFFLQITRFEPENNPLLTNFSGARFKNKSFSLQHL